MREMTVKEALAIAAENKNNDNSPVYNKLKRDALLVLAAAVELILV